MGLSAPLHLCGLYMFWFQSSCAVIAVKNPHEWAVSASKCAKFATYRVLHRRQSGAAAGPSTIPNCKPGMRKSVGAGNALATDATISAPAPKPAVNQRQSWHAGGINRLEQGRDPDKSEQQISIAHVGEIRQVKPGTKRPASPLKHHKLAVFGCKASFIACKSPSTMSAFNAFSLSGRLRVHLVTPL